MDFAKNHSLWPSSAAVTLTPGHLTLQFHDVLVVLLYLMGSRLGRVLVTLVTKRVAVVAVPAAVGFAYFISEFLDEKAKGLIDTIKHVRDPRKDSSTGSTLWRTTVVVGPITKHVTIPKEPGQEKDSSKDSSRLRRVCLTLVPGVVVGVAVVAAVGFGVGGIAAGSLAAKGTPLAATTGFGTSAIGGLQSVGAVGLTASKPFLVGSTVTAAVSMSMSSGEDKEDKEDKKEK